MKPAKPLNANQLNEAELTQLYDLSALWTQTAPTGLEPSLSDYGSSGQSH